MQEFETDMKAELIGKCLIAMSKNEWWDFFKENEEEIVDAFQIADIDYLTIVEYKNIFANELLRQVGETK